MNKEVRFSSIETRADEENKKMIVEGYAIVFNEETLIGTEEHGFIESIDVHISPDDVEALSCIQPLSYSAF